MISSKHTLLLATVMLAVSAPAAHAAAQDESRSYASTAGEKLGIGIINTATGWVEIPKTMIVTTHKDGIAMGLSGGLIKGVAHTLGRTALGVVDLATFVIPTKPMVQPKVVWQDFDKETSYNTTWELYDTH